MKLALAIYWFGEGIEVCFDWMRVRLFKGASSLYYFGGAITV